MFSNLKILSQSQCQRESFAGRAAEAQEVKQHTRIPGWSQKSRSPGPEPSSEGWAQPQCSQGTSAPTPHFILPLFPLESLPVSTAHLEWQLCDYSRNTQCAKGARGRMWQLPGTHTHSSLQRGSEISTFTSGFRACVRAGSAQLPPHLQQWGLNYLSRDHARNYF